MEERNYSEEEIEAKVSEIRKQLNSVSAQGSTQKGKLSSHEIAERQQKKNAAFADALGVSREQNPGDAFNEDLVEQKKQIRMEQNQREYEARQADRESKQRDWEERQASRGDRRDRDDDRRGGRSEPASEKGLDDDLDDYMAKGKKKDRKGSDSDDDRRKRRRQDSDDERDRKKKDKSDSSSSSSGSDSD